jgi:hypothetical protein
VFVFNQLGDVEQCALRPADVHSAEPCAGASDRPLSGLQRKIDTCSSAWPGKRRMLRRYFANFSCHAHTCNKLRRAVANVE